MSDLPQLLESVAALMTKKCNALILSSGGELFGVGDLRPIAAELIDYTLNREFGTDAALDGSQASSGDAVASEVPATHNPEDCAHCRKHSSLLPKLGQCAECPYKLTGIMAQTGCPNCPNREEDA